MGKTPLITVRLHEYRNRPYGLIWKVGNKSGEQSSGTTDRREAERAAGRLEAELQQGLIPATSQHAPITWNDFADRYETEWLEGMSYGSRKGWQVARKKFEAICRPRLLSDVDKSMLSRFRGSLESTVSANSAKSYYRALRAGLGWAESVDLITQVPRIRHRKSGTQSTTIRSRTITAEEFERMLAVVPTIRERKFRDDGDHDAIQLQRFMQGLWYSGLRIDELNRLHWEHSAPLHVDLDGKLPLIVILGAQKNRNDCYLPAPREFWALFNRPGVQRTGLVFPVRSRASRIPQQMTTRNIGKMVSKAGELAHVVVDPRTGKTATAHDLRAAYLTRIASVATMSQTQALARHQNPTTTSQFYVRHQAEELARAAGW